MRLRLTLAVLLLASLPAFSQNFGLQLTGGTVNFGVGPMNITVSPNGGGTNGHLAPTLTPATFSCTKTEAVTLLGAGPFVIRGTTTEFGHQWEVEIVFPHPPGANQGNLSFTSTNWELTGKYTMTIKDMVTGARCSKVVGMSGEYQFAGPKLNGWPHSCPPPPPPPPTNTPGQSPGLTGAMTLGGHGSAFPKFVGGVGTCSVILANQANSRIANKGFDAAQLDYKLTY